MSPPTVLTDHVQLRPPHHRNTWATTPPLPPSLTSSSLQFSPCLYSFVSISLIINLQEPPGSQPASHGGLWSACWWTQPLTSLCSQPRRPVVPLFLISHLNKQSCRLVQTLIQFDYSQTHCGSNSLTIIIAARIWVRSQSKLSSPLLPTRLTTSVLIPVL